MDLQLVMPGISLAIAKKDSKSPKVRSPAGSGHCMIYKCPFWGIAGMELVNQKRAQGTNLEDEFVGFLRGLTLDRS